MKTKLGYFMYKAVFLVSHEKSEDLAMQRLESHMAKPAGAKRCSLCLSHGAHSPPVATIPTGLLMQSCP